MFPVQTHQVIPGCLCSAKLRSTDSVNRALASTPPLQAFTLCDYQFVMDVTVSCISTGDRYS